MAVVKGGKKLEAALRKMGRELARPATLRVGFLEDATYPDGTPVGMIAAIQDFGAPSVGIPPRPFFRNMIAKHKGEWPAAIAKLLKKDPNAERVLALVGEAIAGQLRQSIQDTNAPPLKPATIARKGFAKPLVDTGHMLNSISYDVNVRE